MVFPKQQRGAGWGQGQYSAGGPGAGSSAEVQQRQSGGTTAGAHMTADRAGGGSSGGWGT